MSLLDMDIIITFVLSLPQMHWCVGQLYRVHTRPRLDVNRKKFAHIDVCDTCDLWRAGVDCIANCRIVEIINR